MKRDVVVILSFYKIGLYMEEVKSVGFCGGSAACWSQYWLRQGSTFTGPDRGLTPYVLEKSSQLMATWRRDMFSGLKFRDGCIDIDDT